MKEQPTDWFKGAVGLITLLASVGILFLLFFKDIPSGNKEVVIGNIGLFVGAAITIIGYEFGNSKSSDKKTDLLANSTQIPPNATTQQTTVTESKTGTTKTP